MIGDMSNPGIENMEMMEGNEKNITMPLKPEVLEIDPSSPIDGEEPI